MGYTLDQKVSFCGLPGDETIYFYVQSTDRAGNVTIDDNGGEYYQLIIKAPHYEATPRTFTFDVAEGSTEPITGEIEITNTTEDEEAWPLEYLYRVYPNKHIELNRVHQIFYYIAKEHQLDSDSVYRGDSDTLTFTINPKEIKAGTYDMSFSVETNSSDGDFVVHIRINASAAPAVHFSNYYLIDDKSEDRRCDNTNNDGRFNAGETVALNFEVRNDGSLEAIGGYAHLVLLKEETIYDPNEDACEICGWIHEEGETCDEDGDGEMDEGWYYNWNGYPLERVPAEQSHISVIRDSVNLGSIPADEIRRSIGNFIISASESPG